jgi:hypothetical protein
VNLLFTDLESALEAGYTPSPSFELLHSVADFKSMIEPVVADIHRHTKPLCFRLMKDEFGRVQLHYRHKSSDKKWHPNDEDDDDEQKELFLLTVCCFSV